MPNTRPDATPTIYAKGNVMSDTTTTTDATATATPAAAALPPTPTKVYPTKAEAEANKPSDASKAHRVYEVRKGGTTAGFLWARDYDNAISRVAKLDGYSARLGDGKAVTKDQLAAGLAAMSDADRAALLAAYLPAPTPAPTGKGKK